MLAYRIPAWYRVTVHSLQRYSTAATAKPRTVTSPSVTKFPGSSHKPRSHKLPPDPYLLSNKVTRLISGRQFEEAMELVKNAPIRLQSDVVWNQLIAGFAEYGRCNGAFKTLLEMKRRGFKPNDHTYTILLKALSNNPSENVVERANEVYLTLQESNKMSKIHYNALLKVYARAGAHREMMRTYKQMMESGSVPDTMTYSILFNSFARNDIGTFDELMSIWDEAQAQMKKLVSDSGTPLKVDDRLLAAFINAVRNTGTLAKHFQVGMAAFDEAHGLRISGRGRPINSLNKARMIKPSEATFRSMLLLLNKARKFGLANEYIEELYPLITVDAAAVNAIIAIRYSEQKYSEAVSCLETMKKLNLRPNASTFDMLIRSCGKMYKGREAKDPAIWSDLSKILRQHTEEMKLRKKQSFPDKDLQLSTKSCVEIMRIARAAAAGASTHEQKAEIFELCLQCVESQRWRTALNKVGSDKHFLLAQWISDAYTFLLEEPFESREVSNEKMASWKKSRQFALSALRQSRSGVGFVRNNREQEQEL